VPNQAGGLRFDVYERVHLPEDVAAIDELEEIELVPRIQIVEQGEQVSLKGHLLLTGVYRAEGALGEAQSLEHFIPVEISLPLNRVNRLDDLSVEIDNFDVDLLSARTINITGVLSLYGIEVEQPQEEKSSWEEPFTAVHRRDGKTDSDFQQSEIFSQAQQQEPYRETFQTQSEQGWQEASEAEHEEESFTAVAPVTEQQVEEQAEAVDSSWSGPSEVFQAAINREAEQRREIAERQREAALREAAEVERLQQELVEQREQEIAAQEAQEAAQREFAERQREAALREAVQREAALREAIEQRERRAAQRERELAAQEAARRDSIIAAQREREIREREILERELAAQAAEEFAQQQQLVREHSQPLGIEEDQEAQAALTHEEDVEGLNAEDGFTTAQIDADDGISVDQEQVQTSAANQQLFAEQERIEQELERKEMKVALNSKPSSDESKQGTGGLGFRSLLQSSLREQEARAVAEQTAEKNAEVEETHSGDEIEWKTLFLNRPSEEKGFRKLRICIVQREETLELIAGRYQLQAREIALYNRLPDQSVSEGQVLYIPK